MVDHAGGTWPDHCADAPFYITTLRVDGADANRRLVLITSLGDEVVLGADHPIKFTYDSADQNKGPRPYVNIRGGLDALIARSVYYELAALAEEKDGRFVITSGGDTLVLD